jgi:hypothetical protein
VRWAVAKKNTNLSCFLSVRVGEWRLEERTRKRQSSLRGPTANHHQAHKFQQTTQPINYFYFYFYFVIIVGGRLGGLGPSRR